MKYRHPSVPPFWTFSNPFTSIQRCSARCCEFFYHYFWFSTHSSSLGGSLVQGTCENPSSVCLLYIKHCLLFADTLGKMACTGYTTNALLLTIVFVSSEIDEKHHQTTSQFRRYFLSTHCPWLKKHHQFFHYFVRFSSAIYKLYLKKRLEEKLSTPWTELNIIFSPKANLLLMHLIHIIYW